MKPLIIIQYPQGVDAKTVEDSLDTLKTAHPEYDFLLVSEGVGLSIAHEGNISVAEVIKMKGSQ
jgi:hypothetical protein